MSPCPTSFRSSLRFVLLLLALLGGRVVLLESAPARAETPSWSESLPAAEAWRTDRRLSTTTALRVEEGRLRIEGAYPGSTAAVVGGLWHWAGASVLEMSVRVPPEGAGVKAMAFLRVGKETLFESPLRRLEVGEQVVRWRLPSSPRHGARHRNEPEDGERQGAWHRNAESGGPRQGARHPNTYDLLTVREVGLRFFFDDRATFAIEAAPPVVKGPVEPRELEILDVRPVIAERVRAFTTFELDFQLSRPFRNPYDPEQIAVDLEVKPPGHEGEPWTHPAFFYVPHDLVSEHGVERAVRSGPASWRARFCPWRSGTHRWRLVARTNDGEVATAEGRFEVSPSESDDLWGFVRVSEQDPRHLELGAPGDGASRPYYPIGLNLRSPADERPGAYRGPVLASAKRAKREGTRAYARWLEALGSSGGNFARIWLAPWWGGLEWNAAEDDGSGRHAVPYEGLGYYHQANGARIDRLFELARVHGVRLAVETLPHGLVSSEVDGDWHRSPYNVRQGGPATFATDFFRQPEAVQAHRNLLRHAVARWGASPALAWWGLLTEAEWSEPWYRSLPLALRQEVGWEGARGAAGRQATRPEPYATPKPREDLVTWMESTAAYLKAIDAHPHPTTVQFSIPAFGLDIWHRPGLDIVHNNAYLHLRHRWQAERFGRDGGIADMLQVFGDSYRQLFARPILVGEWGGHPRRNEAHALVAELHVGLWAGHMTGLSGATGFWWWNLVDARDAWSHFAALARFAEGEDRRGLDLASGFARARFPGSDPGVERRALVLHGTDRFRAYVFAEPLNRPFAGLEARDADDPRLPLSGPGSLELPTGLRAGRYLLEAWDTFAGTIVHSEEVEVGVGGSGQIRTIPVPSHRVDIALKLDPVD